MPLIPTENSLLKIVKSLITQAEESPLFVKTIFGDFFDYFDIILTRYPWNDKDKVTSHNDLNPNNLICDGNRLWVVDWDAAFLNDRYADLAITANFYVSNGQEEQLLLGAYFGDGLSPYHSARFFVMRQICRFIYAVHMVNLGNATDADNIIHEPEFKTITMQQFGEQMREGKLSIASSRGQLYFGKASINEALRDMRSPRFEASMKLFS
jgi:thiamine kinase-like enzyme